MRVVPITGLSLLIGVATVAGAAAADITLPDPIIPGRPNLFSEMRLGATAQDVWGRESGSANVAGEILFSKPFSAADLFASYFIPRPHVGGSVNAGGDTSFAYAGVTWSYDLTSWLFVEGSLGGAVHNGNTQSNLATVAPRESALGCSPLFRESGSLGVRLSTNWSVMATVERLSNGGACAQNQGLTNFGARLGFSF